MRGCSVFNAIADVQSARAMNDEQLFNQACHPEPM
jgi:hypothetical protein